MLVQAEVTGSPDSWIRDVRFAFFLVFVGTEPAVGAGAGVGVFRAVSAARASSALSRCLESVFAKWIRGIVED